VRPTHRSLFDNSLQGLAYKDKPAFSFQGHPEASPGPHDLKPLFDRFNHLMLRRLQQQLRAAEEAMRRQNTGVTTPLPPLSASGERPPANDA
jgi:Glutamine amidotransferase class-I